MRAAPASKPSPSSRTSMRHGIAESFAAYKQQSALGLQVRRNPAANELRLHKYAVFLSQIRGKIEEVGDRRPIAGRMAQVPNGLPGFFERLSDLRSGVSQQLGSLGGVGTQKSR